MIFIDKTHKVQATKNCVFYSILIEISYSVRETDVSPQIKKMTLMLYTGSSISKAHRCANNVPPNPTSPQETEKHKRGQKEK